MDVNILNLDAVRQNYKLGKVIFRVKMSQASGIAAVAPMKKIYRAAVLFWFIAFIVSIITGIVLLFIKNWIWGISLVILGFVINAANRKSAAQFIIKYSLENDDYFRYALSREVLSIHNKTEDSQSMKIVNK